MLAVVASGHLRRICLFHQTSLHMRAERVTAWDLGLKTSKEGLANERCMYIRQA